MTQSDDDAIFNRELGEPEKVTASKQPQPAAQANGYFNPQTLRVTAFASDHNQVKASTAAWAGGLMRSCATAKVRDLKPRDIVSYSLPHENKDGVYVGRVVDTDKDNARVEIQQHVLSPQGEWVPVGTRHTIDWSGVHNKFDDWPEPSADSDEEDAEYDEAKVKASFQAYFTSPSPKRKRK